MSGSFGHRRVKVLKESDLVEICEYGSKWRNSAMEFCPLEFSIPVDEYLSRDTVGGSTVILLRLPFSSSTQKLSSKGGRAFMFIQ